MNILICGATGFVGRHLTHTLREAGHTVFRGVRNPTRPNDLSIDYNADIAKETWLPRLKGITVVINAVGVLRDGKNKPMARLHAETPTALFSACAEAGVARIVHFSALGIDSGINTSYFETRKIAEVSLNNLSASIRRLILRPSLIYGDDGASAKLFRRLANLPVHFLPSGGSQTLQPVHINDICEAVTRWIDNPHAPNLTLPAVGAESTTLRGMLDSYRAQTGKQPALHISVPTVLMQISARLGDQLPFSPLCSDTLTMLYAGNTAEAAPFAELLKHPPASYRSFIGLGARNANH